MDRNHFCSLPPAKEFRGILEFRLRVGVAASAKAWRRPSSAAGVPECGAPVSTGAEKVSLVVVSRYRVPVLISKVQRLTPSSFLSVLCCKMCNLFIFTVSPVTDHILV